MNFLPIIQFICQHGIFQKSNRNMIRAWKPARKARIFYCCKAHYLLTTPSSFVRAWDRLWCALQTMKQHRRSYSYATATGNKILMIKQIKVF